VALPTSHTNINRGLLTKTVFTCHTLWDLICHFNIITNLICRQFGLKLYTGYPKFKFLGLFDPPNKWELSNDNEITKGTSESHGDFNMLTHLYSSSSETAWKQKVQRRRKRGRKRKTTIFKVFWYRFKMVGLRTWLFATFLISVCSFCRGQQADTNV